MVQLYDFTLYSLIMLLFWFEPFASTFIIQLFTNL